MRVVFLTGAGISAESGIPTFRGKSGLWNNYKPEDLATPTAFMRDPVLVWKWYDWRRGIVSKAKPNRAHILIAELEKEIDVIVITQNVDGLHQKAGSTRVLELHGNIWRVRCTACYDTYYNYEVPLREIPPRCVNCGGILRPDVVWFGEEIPANILEESFRISENCEVMVVVGTSGVVYPAAYLPFIAKRAGARLVEINPEDTPISSISDMKIREKASGGMEICVKYLRSLL